MSQQRVRILQRVDRDKKINSLETALLAMQAEKAELVELIKKVDRCSGLSVSMIPAFTIDCDSPGSWQTTVRDKYTVVYLVHGYLDLRQLITDIHHAKHLDQILIIWNNIGKHPPVPHLVRSDYVPVSIILPTENKLTSRFLPLAAIRTEAVFHLDCDIRLSAKAIDYFFSVWQNHKQSIVGPAARMFRPQGGYSVEPEVVKTEGYNMVLTGASFVHRDSMFRYSCDPQMRPIVDEVDEVMNGEDISFNIMNHWQSHPPVCAVSSGDCSNGLLQDARLGERQRSTTGLSINATHAENRKRIFTRALELLQLNYTDLLVQDLDFSNAINICDSLPS